MPIEVGAYGTKFVRFTVDVWYQENDGHIHITSPDLDWFHTTVNETPGSKRCHKNMFMKIRRLLEEQGRWPEKQ